MGRRETVKNIHHGHRYDPKRNSTSAFKHKTSVKEKNKSHTYPSPKTLTTPFPPEKLQRTEMMSKKTQNKRNLC